MPYKDPDPDDPLHLVGVPMPFAGEDMLLVKAECLVEEFVRLGHTPESVIAIFQNPEYVGAHELYEKLGSDRIEQIVETVSAVWRRQGSERGE